MKSKLQVDFKPSQKGTVALIHHFNDMVTALTPNESATMFASHIAAIAYLMSENNDAETIKRVFGVIVDDAHKHFEAQKAKAEKKSPIILP